VVVCLGDTDGAFVMFVRFAHRNISKGDCCSYVCLPYSCIRAEPSRLLLLTTFREILFFLLYKGVVRSPCIGCLLRKLFPLPLYVRLRSSLPLTCVLALLSRPVYVQPRYLPSSFIQGCLLLLLLLYKGVFDFSFGSKLRCRIPSAKR